MRRKKNAMKLPSQYSVIIQWSDEDRAYVATLPEWGGCHTHGATYEEAARNAREVLEMLMKDEIAKGNELPTPHEFQHPGPSGFTYQFSSIPATRKVKRATA
jgi:predicted RNase H-like HicB family nuclease